MRRRRVPKSIWSAAPPAALRMDDPRRNAAEGAMLGALIADAAGATLEFKENVSPPLLETALAMRGGGVWKTAPGQVTDDGELSLSLATALVEGKSEFDADQVAYQYSKWVESRPFDIGNTTRKALGAPISKKSGAAGIMRAAAKQHCAQSQSNGSLMRCTPLAVWAHRFTQEEIAEVCIAECSLSHPDETVQNAYICYITAIIYLIRHPKDRKGAWAAVQSWASKHAGKDVREWLKAAEEGARVPFSPNIGWVKIAFVHAFQHLLKGSSYLDALKAVLAGGGDTDTNGCIVGGLIGAAVGVSEIPKEMRDSVLRCDIKAGEQSHRPEWLQTAYAFRRLFASLYDFAPTRLEFTNRPASPTLSPHTSPLRNLSPTKLFGGKKAEPVPQVTTSVIASASKGSMRTSPPASGGSKGSLRVSPEATASSRTSVGNDRSTSPRPPSPKKERPVPPRENSPPTDSGPGKKGAAWTSSAPSGASSRSSEHAGGGLYRVLSLNVTAQNKVNELSYVSPELKDSRTRAQRIAALIAVVQPDIAALQEIEDLMWIELRKMLDDYDSHFVPYANQSEGICVFWRKHRWVMRQAATVPLAPNRTSAIAAHLVFRDHERPEEELAIVTAQLSSDPKKESFRPDESKTLMAHLASLGQARAIIAVDLGVSSDSPLYEAFTALAGNHFCSAYVESSRKEVACTLHTDKEKAARAFLFYQARGLRVVPRSARAYSSNNPLPNVLWPSTHFPLVCDFYNVTPR